MFVGRTGRPASDYRLDGTVLAPHRVPEGELFTRIPSDRPAPSVRGCSDTIAVGAGGSSNVPRASDGDDPGLDPSFGFAWRGTVTFFHGIPVNPFAQRLWLEDGQKRFRIMQQGSRRILAIGDTAPEAIERLDEAVGAGEPDGTPVSAVGQLLLGIWKQFESDETTYLTDVTCEGHFKTTGREPDP